MVGRQGLFPYFFNSTLGVANMRRFLRNLRGCYRAPRCPSRFNTGMFGVTESSRNGHLDCVGVANKALGIGRLLASARGTSRVHVCSNTGFRLTGRTPTKAVYTMANLSRARPKRNFKVRQRSRVPILRPMLGCEVLLPRSYSIRRVLGGLGRLRRRRPRLRVM